MDYTILEKLLEKENLQKKDLWKFFNVKKEEEMEKLISENLKLLPVEIDESFIYMAPANLYKSSIENDHNIFYEKLILISFFLRGFAKYENVLVEAFTRAIGMIKFIMIVEKELKDNMYYNFFINSYQEFKKDKYFREQTERIVSIFDEITEQIESIDLDEIRELTTQIKNNI